MFAKHQISTLLYLLFNSNILLIIPLKLIVYDRMIQWGVDLIINILHEVRVRVRPP